MTPDNAHPTTALPLPLILASTSAYRRELLARLGLAFEICAPGVDETALPDERPADLAMRLALAKAQTVADLHPGAVVIGSDQVADLNGEALGKPGNHERAVAQLRQQSGQSVVFQTAVAVVCHARQYSQTALAQVQVIIRTLSDADIEAYLRAEPAYDCAGSAKSEGLGIALLERIDSDDPTSLIGLPLMRTCAMLRQLGLRVPS
jgi:septum formation protein